MLSVQIIVDNTVEGFYRGEWGFSSFLECDGKKILFDTGYSDLLICNARRLKINLENLDYVVLSHGHNDHARGLEYLINLYEENNLNRCKKPCLIAHPDVFIDRYTYTGVQIGTSINYKVHKYFDVYLTREPIKICKNLYFMGEIKREIDFEKHRNIGLIRLNEKEVEDNVPDDSGLVYLGKKGVIMFSGCAHSGVCNMLEQAKQITKCNTVDSVIGGFHLQRADEVLLRNTVKYLIESGCEKIYPCHCTDFAARLYMAKYLQIGTAGVGAKFSFN